MKKHKRLSVGVAIACLALLGGAVFGGAADAKKKKNKSFQATKTVGLAVPNATDPPFGPDGWGALRSTITVPKKGKFKFKRASDVVVTFQTTGLAADAAEDLAFRLRAPNGRTVNLVGPYEFRGTSIGPLTLTPNSSTGLCFTPAPPAVQFNCGDPDKTLKAPYAGTAGEIGPRISSACR